MAGDAHNWIASSDNATHNKNLFTSPLLTTIVVFSDRIKITVSVHDSFSHVNEILRACKSLNYVRRRWTREADL